MPARPNDETLVEQELVKHLVHLGWMHIQGHKMRPELTGREEFREVLLLDRLRVALRRIHVTDEGEVWLDEGRIAQAVGAAKVGPAGRRRRLSKHLVEAGSRLPAEFGEHVDGLRTHYQDTKTPRKALKSFVSWCLRGE